MLGTILIVVEMAACGLLGALLVLLLAAVVIEKGWPSREERLMRERRRHAKDAARAMRRMTRIRHKTIRRMDQAERQW